MQYLSSHPYDTVLGLWRYVPAGYRNTANSSGTNGGSYVYDEESKYEPNGKKTGHFDSTDWTYGYTSYHLQPEFVQFIDYHITGFGGFYVPPSTSSWSVNETTTTLHGDHYFDMGTASGNTETLFETSSTPPVVNNVPINPHHYGDWPKFEAYTPSSVWVDAAGGFWAGLKYGGATILSNLPFGGRFVDLDRLAEEAGLDETTRWLTDGAATTSFVAIELALLLSTGGGSSVLLNAARTIDKLEKLERLVNTVELAAAGDFEELGKQAAAKLISTQLGAKNGKANRTGPLHAKPVQANLNFNGPGIGDTPVPNPNGRRGSPAHQAKVKQRADELEKKGHTITGGGGGPERAIELDDGRKRFPDISTVDPDGNNYYENIGKTLKNGDPVARERRVLDEIEKSKGRRPGYTGY